MIEHDGTKRGSERHHYGRRGTFIDMRPIRITQLVTNEDKYVDVNSGRQIFYDVRIGIHKWNIRYYGVVRDGDVPDFSTVGPENLKYAQNCKNDSYFNCFVYCGIGENTMKNVNWYILPP